MAKLHTVNISSDSGSVQGYGALPKNLVHQLAEREALPVTIGGTSNRTFTLNASESAPVTIMIGNDVPAPITASVAYSWVVGSNAILDATGAETTLTNSTVGWWYYYISYDATDGTHEILPSATAPAYASGAADSRVLVHPGTAKTQAWTYVGCHYCNATTPTFLAAEKIGFDYHFVTKPGTPVLTAVIATDQGALASFAMPKHGVQVNGIIETGGTAGDWAWVSGSASDTVGACFVQTAAGAVAMGTTGYFPVGSGGLVYGDAKAAGDFHVIAIRDRV